MWGKWQKGNRAGRPFINQSGYISNFFGGKHSLNVKNVNRSCEKKHFTEAGQQKHFCKKYVRVNIESAFFSGLNSVQKIQWGLHFSKLLLSIRKIPAIRLGRKQSNFTTGLSNSVYKPRNYAQCTVTNILNWKHTYTLYSVHIRAVHTSVQFIKKAWHLVNTLPFLWYVVVETCTTCLVL